MTHLTSDELIDAMEEVLPAGRRSHLAECDECQRQLDDLSSVLDEAKQVSTPEPSPLFWNHFSTRVNEGIDAAIDADSAGAWPQWLRWQVLLPLGATAMIILALMLAVPKHDPVDTSDDTTAVAVESLDVDNWGAFSELVGELDLETASAAGVIEPGMAEQAVLQLTAEEQQELTRLLQTELARVKS